MSLEIKKEKGESTQSLLQRFSKAMQHSGILIRARRGQFKRRKLSKDKRKMAALRREELKKKYIKLKKSGAIK